MNQKLYNLIEASPVIATIKDIKGLDVCCRRDEIKMVFTLFGNICGTSAIIGQIKESDKIVMMHIDLIIGLSSREVAVDLIRNNTNADGIILTKPALIKRVREPSLYTTLKVFVLDLMAFENIEKQMSAARPDIIEILLGLVPKAICRVCRLVKVPVIAERLISGKEDVMVALSAGAISISATNQKVWPM